MRHPIFPLLGLLLISVSTACAQQATASPQPVTPLVTTASVQVSPAATTQATTGTFSVCIDPGHPSEVSAGTALLNGMQEVTVCWEVALLLKANLEARGVRVVMTKDQERQVVSNKQRAEIANQAKVDFLVRLHTESMGSTGFATYYPRKEGVAKDGHRGPSQAVLAATKPVAERFHAALVKALEGKLPTYGLRGDEQTAIGSKQGALTGSIYSEVPAVVVEMVVLSNKSDAEWIAKPENKAILANALAEACLATQAK